MSSPTAVSSDATKVSIVSTDGSANAGISEIGVAALAASQRNKSNQYSSATQSINSGAGFTLTLTPGSAEPGVRVSVKPAPLLIDCVAELYWLDLLR